MEGLINESLIKSHGRKGAESFWEWETKEVVLRWGYTRKSIEAFYPSPYLALVSLPFSCSLVAFFLPFLEPLPQHMEVPKLGV